ncbi:hypothetical protein [Magnetovibrio blakemorei]|uniref:Uncharacterized protein n=1 Tax=Magnetovibrio blakemorei TaxID=28181 RepID=A0A1E5QA85_9PROT|nr:hypothetical protein [Magnetovibrio blakemorei]OEJ68583.1 hypothetical protein BEN30_00090 [Magnetovibrio blakemorei]
MISIQKITTYALGFCVSGVLMVTTLSAGSAKDRSDPEVAAVAPVYLQLEITSACTDDGAVFKVINRGVKWPKSGYLRLYYADDKSVLGERKLRLAPGQKVSFNVTKDIMAGHPVAIWVEPEWYEREMEYDATIDCN